MNRSPLDAGNSRLWKSLLTGRDDLSWAGAAAGDRGFCYGTEDGSVFWTNFDGVQYGDPLPNAALDDYDEAINGVAFNDGRMVVTTRSGSAIWKNAEGKAGKRKAGPISEGSHGVVAALNGAFFLPLNIGGLMSVQDSPPGRFTGFTSTSESMDLNIYRVASLTSSDGSQVVAIAARSGGVAAGMYQPGRMLNLATLEMADADFIDICPTGYSEFPTSAYALTRDNHILAFNNILDIREHGLAYFEAVAGVAYRILSAGQFVFILNSRALHVIRNLVTHSPGSFRVNQRTQGTTLPLQAIDINLVGGRWLLVLLVDRVLRLDLDELAKVSASDFEEKVSELSDVWANATVRVRQLDSRTSEFATAK